MLPDLSAFQREFATAVMSDDPPALPFRSPAFAVYRNTTARGTVEALRATYSTVNVLLGDEGFTQVALEYRHEAPPPGPVLSDYGAGFADFLARQAWSSELPYLADVARLDWLWLESFLAADANSLPRQVGRASRIMLHPAARFAWLATPALTIWQAHRDGFDELEPEWCEEGALFTRPGFHVRTEPIDRATHRLMLACAAPARVDEVVRVVADAFPQANIPQLLQRCVVSGALIIQ